MTAGHSIPTPESACAFDGSVVLVAPLVSVGVVLCDEERAWWLGECPNAMGDAFDDS